MKNKIIFGIFLICLSACDSYSYDVKKQNPSDWLEGKLILVVNPYNSADSVLAIKVKWGLFPSDMNGREYILTMDKSPVSFMENGKIRDSLFIPIGNRKITQIGKDVKKIEGYTIYYYTPDEIKDDLYFDYPNLIEEEQKVYINRYVSLINISEIGNKPYTYEETDKNNNTIYLFEITTDTDFDDYYSREGPYRKHLNLMDYINN